MENTEKPMTQEEAERKIKTQIKLLELQSQAFDEKMNKIREKIHALEKENKKIVKENGDKSKIALNNEKLAHFRKKLRDLKKEKGKSLGCELDLNYADDTKVRPFVDI